jgi:hypothetical protein
MANRFLVDAHGWSLKADHQQVWEDEPDKYISNSP